MRCLTALMLLVVVMLIAACDPLAPDPTQAALARATHTPTAPPTAVPSLTPSHTPTQTRTPTATSTFPPTATFFACTEKTGQVVTLQASSEEIDEPIPFRAYLPPCYDITARRYPFLMLLGEDDAPNVWLDEINLTQTLDQGIDLGTLPPMIVILPDGGEIAAAARFGRANAWDVLLLNAILDTVERNFCTWNEREGRAIAGYGRGGFWALTIAFREPEVFGAIGAFSPELAGDNSPASVNPLALARSIDFPPGTQPRFWVDVGEDDDSAQGVAQFAQTLQNREIALEYIRYSGNGSPSVWRDRLPRYLAFLSALWTTDVRDLPSCLQ